LVGTERLVVDQGDGGWVWGEAFWVFDELIDLESLRLHELEGFDKVGGGDAGIF